MPKRKFKERLIEVESYVSDWSDLLSRFGVPVSGDPPWYIDCPDPGCSGQVGIKMRQDGSGLSWSCNGCHAQKQHFSNYLGLIFFFQLQADPGVTKPQLLGEMEDYLLGKMVSGVLPSWTPEFGKYCGKPLGSMPPSYVRYLIDDSDEMPSDVKLEVARCWGIEHLVWPHKGFPAPPQRPTGAHRSTISPLASNVALDVAIDSCWRL